MLPRGAARPRRTSVVLALALATTSLLGCDKLAGKDAVEDAPAKTSSVAAPLAPPPVAPVGTPLAQFADADVANGSPYEQARTYEASGQLWMARLVLEQKALGSDATKSETELLGRICHEQADDKCLDACAAKLGHKLTFDAGARRPRGSSVDSTAERNPTEGATPDLARAQELATKGRNEEARAVLEPRVLSGKASRAEISTLQAVCLRQGDRMCVALCDAKLKGK